MTRSAAARLGTADAIFRFPDFFNVGIAESGNHDQRVYEDDLGERYQGLVEKLPDNTDSYDIEAHQTFAKNLKGHLLLADGVRDQDRGAAGTLNGAACQSHRISMRMSELMLLDTAVSLSGECLDGHG